MKRSGSAKVIEEIERRISQKGHISFSEFMEIALYWPYGGYYTSRLATGARGDFYSSPTLHPVFGALVTRQLREMWIAMGGPSRFWLIELGAGTGQLAADITSYAREFDAEFADALRYVAVDVHGPMAGDRGSYDWLVASGVPVREVQGCILANELLDAMPVHRVTVEGDTVREVYVALDRDGHFVEVTGPPSTPALEKRLEGLGIGLTEGSRAEINLGLEPWIANAYESLRAGYVLLVDYGHEAEAYYDSARKEGTLRCYYRHTVNANPYQHVGEQDISVHVEMTSLRRFALRQGFVVVGETSQGAFLDRLGLQSFRQSIAERQGIGFAERKANLQALDTLADPRGLGGFRVVALGKGVSTAKLRGFADAFTSSEPASAPLATPHHVAYVGDSMGSASMPSWDELLGNG